MFGARIVEHLSSTTHHSRGPQHARRRWRRWRRPASKTRIAGLAACRRPRAGQLLQGARCAMPYPSRALPQHGRAVRKRRAPGAPAPPQLVTSRAAAPPGLSLCDAISACYPRPTLVLR